MYKIALECKPDETLIKALGYTRKMIVHQPNKGRVINYLQRNPGALGIVDEDPGSPNPTFYSKFQEEFADQFNIRSLHLPKEGTRLIVIRPRLEEWIIQQALLSNIELQQYSLPKNGHKLHKIINTRLAQFQNLVKDLLNLQNEGMVYLKNLVWGDL